jgi:hypothetical protein
MKLLKLVKMTRLRMGKSTQMWSGCPSICPTSIFTRFVLVRVGYLSISEAYTNNWGLFGKENYLAFDWQKKHL